MNKFDLKPCPKCGGNWLGMGKASGVRTPRIIRKIRKNFPIGVTCIKCGYYKRSRRAWNRRVDNETD